MNWGLGHATRMIPVIQELIRLQCNVILAGSGQSLLLLKAEFPELTSYQLPDYKLQFNSIIPIGFSVAMQGIKLYKKIKSEKEALEKLLETTHVDAIISDNRYGLYSHKIPSILITHQLKLPPRTPFSFIANLQLKKYLHNFSELWIPDIQGSVLTGVLSDSEEFETKKYIGILTRFTHKPVTKRKDFILVTLSGTEPHRTQLENKIIRLFNKTSYEVTLLRGNPSAKEKKVFPKNFTVHEHLSIVDFEELLLSCKLVISRCGYSSIMDISITQTPAILLTTKGQSEQEYLGKRLVSDFNMCVTSRKKLSLSDLSKANSLNLNQNDLINSHLGKWVSDL